VSWWESVPGPGGWVSRVNPHALRTSQLAPLFVLQTQLQLLISQHTPPIPPDCQIMRAHLYVILSRLLMRISLLSPLTWPLNKMDEGEPNSVTLFARNISAAHSSTLSNSEVFLSSAQSWTPYHRPFQCTLWLTASLMTACRGLPRGKICSGPSDTPPARHHQTKSSGGAGGEDCLPTTSLPLTALAA
jgi:hypothetical protein